MESKGGPPSPNGSTLPQTPPITQRQAETLPHSFAFHYADTQLPKTPEAVQQDVRAGPPNPPKVRIRRRRRAFLGYDGAQDDEPLDMDHIPSIELSELEAPLPLPRPDQVPGLLLSPSLASLVGMGRFASPPRTPLSQVHTSFGNNLAIASPWSSSVGSPFGASITRPSSTFSDSSISSISSSETFASKGGSCTSPETDGTDPFVFSESKKAVLASPAEIRPQATVKRVKKHSKVKWTPDMDNHLWLSYMAYMSDPVVTPFKTLPGTAPPLGVCYRVARNAKKGWKGRRTNLQTVEEDPSATFASLDATIMRREASAPPKLEDSPDTIRPVLINRSSSGGIRRVMSEWPRSSSSTRKRLRHLCKHKSALTPHYQRLMENRSPSPFESSSSRPRFSSPPLRTDGSTFSTRDMNVSLATSTAASMQPGGPLSQLASEPRASGPRTPPPRSPRTGAHQKSQSLQFTLGLGNQQEPAVDVRRLASPFHEKPHQMPAPPLPPPMQSVIQQPKRLDSPLELHHPRPLSSSMKRRAHWPLGEESLSEDPEIRRDWLQTMLDDPSVANGKRRMRRGFSLGAARHSLPQTRHISDLYAAPDATDASDRPMISHHAQNQPSMHEVQPSSGSSQLGAPMMGIQYQHQPHQEHPLPRPLGSPFAPIRSNVGLSNTFPRSLFPQGLDSVHSFEQQQHAQQDNSVNTGSGNGSVYTNLADPFLSGPVRAPYTGR